MCARNHPAARPTHAVQLLAVLAFTVAIHSSLMTHAAANAAVTNEVAYTPDRVLCFGDSITEGTYINGKWNRGNSWVNVLNNLASGEITAVNAGRSGRRTSDMKGLNKAIEKNTKVDHVILFLGVNDLRISTDKVLDTCLVNTDASVKRIREAYDNVKITIVSSPGLDVPKVAAHFAKMGYNGKEHAIIAKLRVRYRDYAKAHNCHFIDLWGAVSPGNFSDGLHPNTTGQKQIANAIWQHWPIPKMVTTTAVTHNRDKRIYDWMTRHKQTVERNKTFKPDIITIGDSITHYWSGEPKAKLHWGDNAWTTLYKDYKTTNLGFGWDRTENVIWRLQNGAIQNISPILAVVLIGTNNLAVNNTPRQIVWGIKSVVKEIQTRCPKTKVLVVDLLPRKRKFAYAPGDVNKLLASLDDGKTVSFVDASKDLTGKDGKPLPHLYRDGVHVNAAGYSVLANTMRPAIKELLRRQ